MNIEALNQGLIDWAKTDGGIILVDLDETLCLRNSSQAFLDVARPSVFAAIILRALQATKPWRWTGSDTADCWRVLAIGVLMPWTFWLWRRHVPLFAATHRNAALALMLAPLHRQVVIATLGFGPIVRPLVAAMGYGDRPLIACRFGRFADRRRGKLALVERAVGAQALAGAMVITDSSQDQPLLDRCAASHLLQWPDARYTRALDRPVLPFDYLALVKRPGKAATKAVFVEDFTSWIIATAPYCLSSPALAAALLCAFLSFWSVYEIGYAENDRMALEYEVDPTLSDRFAPDMLRHAERRGWTFALLFGAAAVLLATVPAGRIDPGPAWVGGLVFTGFGWGVLLIALRGTYALYNRVDKQSRVWIYALLQLFRATAFIMLLPVNVFAPAFCGALAVARWISYFIYRRERSAATQAAWPAIPQRFIRFVLLAMLLPACVPAAMAAPITHWFAGVAGAGWWLLLARGPLRQVIANGRRIDRMS